MKIKQLFTLALAAGISATSVAETKYGESILNTATLNFTVNNQKQVETSAAASFVVDRKVIVNVYNPETVIPSGLIGTGQAITYTISNLSNAPIGMKFNVKDLVGDEIIYDNQKPDNTNGPAITYEMFVDGNNNGTYESASDTTSIAPNGKIEFNQLGDSTGGIPDTIVVHVIATPTEGVDGDVFGHDLEVTAVEPTSGNTLPNDNAAGWDDQVVQTILKDNTDLIKGRGGISISSATLLPKKVATIVSDPINGVSATAKAVPGAIIKYTITVTNSGSVAATDLIIEDTLPAEFDLQKDITDGGVVVFTIDDPDSTPVANIQTSGNTVTFPKLTVPAKTGGVDGKVEVSLTVKLL